MALREISKDQWQTFCNAFSRLHENWLADVQVLGEGTMAGFEAKGLPFGGISYDTKGSDKNEISIFMSQKNADDITHVVEQPTHLRVEQTQDEVDQGLEIEAADGTKTFIRFLHPMRSEVVDRT